MKYLLTIAVIVILSILLLLWGNLAFTFCCFKIMGIEYEKIGYFNDDDLAANIVIHKNNKVYHITLKNIKPSLFLNSDKISISQINGYGIIAIGCNTAAHKVVYHGTLPIGYRWYGSNIYFEKNSIINDTFEIQIENIYDLFDNIDIIEEKLMKFSRSNYTYFQSKLKDEIYIKGIKVDSIQENWFTKDSVLTFTFKNPDCCCGE